MIKKIGLLLVSGLDYLSFFILGLVGGIVFAVLLLRRTKVSVPNIKPRKRILCLNPMRWEWVEKKGILSHVLLLNYGNYWDHFYLIHLSTPETQRISVTGNISVWEFGRGKVLPRLGFRFSGFLLDEIRFVREMLHFIKENDVDVIKSQEPYINGIRGVILRQLTGCPLVEDVRANYDLIYKATGRTATGFAGWRWMEKLVERIAFWRADMVLVGSRDASEFAIRNGAKVARTFMVQTRGVSEEHFKPLQNRRDLREELGLKGKKLILCVGRLSEEKYPQDVIMSFAEVSRVRQDCVLLLAGDGDQRKELEAIVADLGLNDKVRFLGFQPQEMAMNLMFTSDVIVAPLSGSALVETCLSSTPVVAYDVDWHPEMVKDGETGLLVPFRDYMAMAQAALRLLDNPELAKRLGENARNFTIVHHHPDVIYREERRCFEKLFSGQLL